MILRSFQARACVRLNLKRRPEKPWIGDRKRDTWRTGMMITEEVVSVMPYGLYLQAASHHALMRELPRRAEIIKVGYPNAVRRQLPAVPIIAKAVSIPCPCPATGNVSLRHMMKTMRTRWLRNKQLRVGGSASHVHNIHPTCRY